MKKDTNITLSIIIITLLLMMTSCKKSPWVHGDVVTVTRDIPAFNSLSLHNNIDVTLIMSDSFKIELTTCENLINSIISRFSAVERLGSGRWITMLSILS